MLVHACSVQATASVVPVTVVEVREVRMSVDHLGVCVLVGVAGGQQRFRVVVVVFVVGVIVGVW